MKQFIFLFFWVSLITNWSFADERKELSNIRETEFSRPPLLKFSDVLETIEREDIRTIKDFVKVLPERYRKHYTFLYKSHSLQPASPEFPRIITYGGDGRLFMTFAGDPSKSEFHTIESAELEESSGRYHFRRLVFDPQGKNKPTFQDSPPICMSCHGLNPKPIWDAYPFWRGAYGSRSHNKLDRMSNGSLEHQFYQQFLKKQRERGIYALFPQNPGNEELEKRIKQKGHAVTFTPNGVVNDPTAFVSEQLGEIMMRAAAQEIKRHPKFQQFKYPMAFAALCENSVLPKVKVNGVFEPNPSYIQPEKYLSSDEAKKLPDFWEQYFKKITSDHDLRAKEAQFYNPVSTLPMIGSPYPADESDLSNFGTIRHEHKANWIYLLGLMGIDPRPWALSFDHGAFALEEGGPPAYLRLGYLLFHKDPEINKYFPDQNYWFYKQASPEACLELAQKSQQAMLQLSAGGAFSDPFPLLVTPSISSTPLPKCVPQIVNKCLACHAFTGGAHPIPFDRPAELSFALGNKISNGKARLIEDIVERIDSGDMPRRGVLTNQEKEEIKDYVRKVFSGTFGENDPTSACFRSQESSHSQPKKETTHLR